MIDIRYLVFITYSTGCTYNWLPIYIYIYTYIYIYLYIYRHVIIYRKTGWGSRPQGDLGREGEAPAEGPREGGRGRPHRGLGSGGGGARRG